MMIKKKIKRIKYSWNEFDKDIERLAKVYRKHVDGGLIKNIYGVPRGGLIVAVALSHQLEIPIIIKADRISGNTLIVDDISDTGVVLHKVTKNRKYFDVITLWVVPTTSFMPTTYRRMKEVNEWVLFPWETYQSSKYDGTI